MRFEATDEFQAVGRRDAVVEFEAMPPKLFRLPRKSVAPRPLALMPPGNAVGLTSITESPRRFASMAAMTAPEESP